MLPRMAIRSAIISPRPAAARSGCGQKKACGCACGTSIGAAVADQVVRLIPLGGLDAEGRLPGGMTGPQLTPRKWSMSVSMSCMVRSFTGRRGQGMVGLVRAAGHVLQALLDDPEALAHLFDADDGPAEAVAVPAPSGCRTRTAHSLSRGAFFRKSHSRPQARRLGPVTPQSIASSSVQAPTPFVRAFEDAVPHDHPVVLVEPLGQVVQKFPDHPVPAWGRSWATPPMRNHIGCIRPPQIASTMRNARSRSLNV